jgi:hypothetical protein
MRRAAATLVTVSAALCTCVLACFDLFHSTRDIRTICEIDASAPGCVGSNTGGVPTPPDAGEADFCAWTPPEARRRAEHVCAWLGACESPMGRNSFGPCMFQALLAYDCSANPNHPVQGKSHALWGCLSGVASCGDVDACVFPGGAAACEPAANRTVCGTVTGAVNSNTDVRFECTDGGPSHPNAYGENCALWGQTCASNGRDAICAGMAGLSCGNTKACVGRPRTELQWCVDGSDLGIDCASNGEQFCNGVADAAPSWLACAVQSDAGACTPDPSATCANGVAFSCPTGSIERIDCASLLQSDAGCEAGALAPPFDWTSPCVIQPSGCAESCLGTVLTGCARGAAFPVDCATEGLGACRTVRTDTGSAEHVACAPPQR